MNYNVKPIKSYNKEIVTPPDKSITHRGILFSAFTDTETKIYNALLGADCRSSIDCVSRMGASVSLDGSTVIVKGADPRSCDMFVGNSGTTMRLISGMLAGHKNREFTLDGDDSIRSRPMNRVILPLSQMGANIVGKDGKAPLKIVGAPLKAIDYSSPVASAQVKSAILLAGLNADGVTSVTEPVKSRDHTEKMLTYFGCDVKVDGNRVSVTPAKIKPQDIEVVGDISSAAYPLVLASSLKGARVKVKNVGLNPTRDGVLRVLDMCGASYEITNKREEAETSGDIELCYKELKSFNITAELVPLLVDEIPILAVLACFINGTSVISGAQELKFKESNRIDTVVNSLKLLGADITATDDGMIINGHGSLKGGAVIESHHDHRIAMSMAIAGVLSENGATILNADCACVSYPDFYEILE